MASAALIAASSIWLLAASSTAQAPDLRYKPILQCRGVILQKYARGPSEVLQAYIARTGGQLQSSGLSADEIVRQDGVAASFMGVTFNDLKFRDEWVGEAGMNGYPRVNAKLREWAAGCGFSAEISVRYP